MALFLGGFLISLTLCGHSRGWLLRVYPLWTWTFLLDWVIPELTLGQGGALRVELTFIGQPCNFLQKLFGSKFFSPPQIHVQIPTVKYSHSEIFLSLNNIFLYFLASVLCSFPSQVNDGTRRPLETIALIGKATP